MQIVKAGLKNSKPAELVGKCEHVEIEMTGNVNFSKPSPSIADMTAARTELVAAITAAQDGGHAAIAIKNAAAKKLARMLVALSRYVNSVAAGDVPMAVSSGFELAKRPEPNDKLDAPAKFSGRTGALEGQVDLKWRGVRGARMYQAFICEGDPLTTGTWRSLGYTTAARFTVDGLDTDHKYAFRVIALGTIGEGPVSETVTAKAA